MEGTVRRRYEDYVYGEHYDGSDGKKTEDTDENQLNL
jgi:hypothetical protein